MCIKIHHYISFFWNLKSFISFIANYNILIKLWLETISRIWKHWPIKFWLFAYWFGTNLFNPINNNTNLISKQSHTIIKFKIIQNTNDIQRDDSTTPCQTSTLSIFQQIFISGKANLHKGLVYSKITMTIILNVRDVLYVIEYRRYQYCHDQCQYRTHT